MSRPAPTLDLQIPPEEPVIRYSRLLRAPRDLVFRVFTEPEHLRRWWGPSILENVVCEIDLRVGGGYRIVQRAPDGQEFAFRGEYLELDPPRRVVSTFVFEGAPDHEAVETLVLEEIDGGTMVYAETRHDSLTSRDAHVASGMEVGLRESHDRLDQLLTQVAAQ
jgi:uncharacterized protein YndB with AHSA1/START domain